MTDECTIIVFPLSKRIGKVRRCADVLRGAEHEANREAYWRKTVGHYRDKLSELGIDCDAADAQIRQFRNAVKDELTRLEYAQPASSNPRGGAA